MTRQLIVWTLAAAAVGFGYLVYEMHSSRKEECPKQPYVSTTICAIERK